MSPYYEDPSCRLYVGDAMDLPLEDESIDCIVTSPPYNCGMDYAGVSDRLSDADYAALAHSSAVDWFRVSRPGARVWVNVANFQEREDGRGNPSRVWYDALEDAGFRYRDTVIWFTDDGDQACAWGSYLSPNAPNLRGRYEPILLFYKDGWPKGRVERNDIPPDKWSVYTRNVWLIKPIGRNGHPAPFPPELPRRCILLSTWPGDVVLDPFCGSGTTIKVAKVLGRYGIGVDLSKKYVEMTRRRVAQEAFAW